ncbi:MAG: NUDIX hydrolase [Pseudomonadota bacterium]
MSWKTLNSSVVFENPWMRVYDDDVENPRGGFNRYGWVHFKNRAIAIVPIDSDGNTWLVGQDRYTLGKYSWELPMGGGALNEPPLAAAQRELAEETGLVANDWRELMHVAISNSITDERGIVFVARDLTAGTAAPDETEKLAVRQLPFSEAVKMVLNGDIDDALTATALLRVAIETSASIPRT